jgi:anti-anti-sigma factor
MVHIVTDTTTKPEIAGLFVRGQLDLSAMAAFREGLVRAMGASRVVEIHLGEVDFIDGCGLSVLLEASARARRAGNELSIPEASLCVRRLIEITDTAERLPSLPGGSEGRFKPDVDRETARKSLEGVGTRTFKA